MNNVRPATQADCEHLAPLLRDEDVREIKAAGGSTPLAALMEGLKHSKECHAMLANNGEVVGMCGVVPTHDPMVGCVWMLCTHGLIRNRVTFLRTARGWLAAMHDQWPVLTNLVDERNAVHIKLLKWLGVSFIKRHHLGPHAFLEFISIRKD